ncbi:hypothetical protein CASFOL_012192 [Castilleja foliolosa]|uniref:Uncharacterized protein n=1 Tax=Castilleja foliolosa TaxID=1961234 RepID=A0ABD3DTR8_9LAMI
MSKYYTPECTFEYTPFLNQEFKSLEAGIDRVLS